MTENADVKDIRDLAFEVVAPIHLDLDALYTAVIPDGAQREVFNLEEFRAQPFRRRGVVELHTQESFAHFVNEHKDPLQTHLYVDRFGLSFTAVLNDSFGPQEVVESDGKPAIPLGGSPEWGDHRAVLKLRHTPEWLHWIGKDNVLMNQVAFAEHIEDGLDEIVEPTGAYMLEMAQTFHANTNVEFRQAETLSSGERQFSYVENTTAGAGRQQQLKIPQEIQLAVAPFEGTQPYKLFARLRYRLVEGGHLQLGYKLVRPQDVIKTSFEDTAQWIADDTKVWPLAGAAPSPRKAPKA